MCNKNFIWFLWKMLAITIAVLLFKKKWSNSIICSSFQIFFFLLGVRVCVCVGKQVIKIRAHTRPRNEMCHAHITKGGKRWTLRSAARTHLSNFLFFSVRMSIKLYLRARKYFGIFQARNSLWHCQFVERSPERNLTFGFSNPIYSPILCCNCPNNRVQ